MKMSIKQINKSLSIIRKQKDLKSFLSKNNDLRFLITVVAVERMKDMNFPMRIS